jgi:hypothetical protein
MKKKKIFLSIDNFYFSNNIQLLLDLKQLVEQVFLHVASMVDQLLEDLQHQVQVMVRQIQYLVEESK